ncbi:MAG: hypothetical protein K2L55_04330 [Muribaculaceae bacterium]|nr:hypothetical protein [Muribaculaceae bacterium]
MKKVFYSIAAAAILFGTTACGGDKSNDKTSNQETSAELSADNSEDFNEEYVEEDISADEDEEESSESADCPLLNPTEVEEYLANAKSGDIDRMLDAYVWYNNAKSKNRDNVRALDKNAIAIAVELDKLDDDAGKKYDSYGLNGALSNKTGEMSNEQLTRYNNISTCLYFTIDDQELSEKFNTIYREIRYGSPF